MTFILPVPQVLNQPLSATPRCAQHVPTPNTSRSLSVAAVGVAAAALISGWQVVEAIELPNLPLPPLPSVSIPKLPDLSIFAGEQQAKDSSTDFSQEEQGRADDMMAKLEAKKKARATKM